MEQILTIIPYKNISVNTATEMVNIIKALELLYLSRYGGVELESTRSPLRKFLRELVNPI